MARQGIVVKGVHGLSVLFHHVVGDIHDVVDGTDSAGRQAALHPLGGGSQLDVLHHSRAVAGAQLRVFHPHLQVIVDILAVSGGLYHRRMEFFSKCGGRLPGDSHHAVAVHAVGGDLILEHHVAQAQHLHCVGAHPGVLRENVDAALRRQWIHVAVGTQLLDGAHHSVGLDASELTLFDLDSFLGKGAAVMAAGYLSAVQNHRNLVPGLDVGRAGDDLNRLPGSDVHLADDQLVRVRMTLDGKDLADNNLFKVFIETLESLHLGAGEGHCVRVLLSRDIQVRNVCFNPG